MSNPQPTFDIPTLEKGIRLFQRLGTASWVANLILLALAIYQFVLVGCTIKVDTFFVVVNVLNIVTFYLTYKVYDHLALLKVRHTYILNNPTPPQDHVQ
jgi:hypothetical protein